jgi:hypothetical protein
MREPTRRSQLKSDGSRTVTEIAVMHLPSLPRISVEGLAAIEADEELQFDAAS